MAARKRKRLNVSSLRSLDYGTCFWGSSSSYVSCCSEDYEPITSREALGLTPSSAGRRGGSALQAYQREVPKLPFVVTKPLDNFKAVVESVSSEYQDGRTTYTYDGSTFEVRPDRVEEAITLSHRFAHSPREHELAKCYDTLFSSALSNPQQYQVGEPSDLHIVDSGGCYMLMEIKTAGGYGCESVQVMQDYRVYARGQQKVCPCLLITARGWFDPLVVYGAVYVDNETILYTRLYESSDIRAVNLVSFIVAIKKVTNDLREQQGDSPNLGSLTIDTRQLGVDRELVVTDLCHCFPKKMVFEGKLNSTTVMVKICKGKYGEAVHRAMAAKDHSPRLIDCLKVTDDTFLVVMEKFDSEMLDVYWESVLVCEKKSKKRTIEQQLRNILSFMHRQGYVHGDLRDPNILVSGKSEIKLKIVDFNWAGKVGEVKYPSDLNTYAFRCARPWQKILMEHDSEQVDYIIRNL